MVNVDVARDGVRIPLSAERVREIVRTVCRRERVGEAMISVAFVTDRAMARLNREHLGHTGPTDVITFRLGSLTDAALGDIYIAPGVARGNARMHGTTMREELTRLVVHGTLHVLGHDHPEGNERTRSAMWRRQERLVAALG